MKHNLTKLFTITILFSVATVAYAQPGGVGINTSQPKSNLDVNGRKDGSGNLLTTDVAGLQAPRLTRAELTSKGNALYGADQKGALVYITDISGGDVASQRVNMTTPGYYYFDGSAWLKVSTGSVTANNGLTANTNTVKLGGTLTEATVIAQSANTLSFTGTATSLVKITNTTGTVTTPVSALQITDGSQAVGKVLTSDANGNTSWTYSALKAIPGNLPTTTVSFSSYGAGTPPNISMYTGGSIVLPPGKWMVSFGAVASMGQNDRINTSDAQLWCTAFLSNSSSSNVITTDYIAAYTGQRGSGGSIGRGMNRTMVTGAIAINNTSGADKTYYLWANQELENYSGGPTQININGTSTPGYWLNLFGNGNWERYFYAIPIQ